MASYFFYDLETSGLNPRSDRIMQFAGIRTNEKFEPIGEPYNLLITLTDDTLPSPDALLVTGITPQQTVADGYSEAEFAKLFVEEVCTPDTTIVGYNNIRFDDEFIRALLWRNFYDPYAWSYKDGRSRWDMLDVVRMTRALRPDGIAWPIVDGVPVNKLELLSKENNLTHEKAHDALSDVEALIGITKLIADAQPQLFSYLFSMRHKNAVAELVNLETPRPFVYASGRYPSAHNKATVALPIAAADHGNVYVYDLRHNPEEWVHKTDNELRAIQNTPYKQRGADYQPLPVKKLQYNRAPAVAPLGVLEQHDGWQKIGLDAVSVQTHYQTLQKYPEFAQRIAKVLDGRTYDRHAVDAESRLYDGFVASEDARMSEVVRNASSEEIGSLSPTFDDERLAQLFPRYKVRNYRHMATAEELAAYEEYRVARIQASVQSFMQRLQACAGRASDEHSQYVLEELRLWLESVIPESD